MARLLEFFAASKTLLRQQRELVDLRKEVAALKTQNDSMREGMRRCVTCEYRIEFKQRQDALTETVQPPSPPDAVTKP